MALKNSGKPRQTRILCYIKCKGMNLYRATCTQCFSALKKVETRFKTICIQDYLLPQQPMKTLKIEKWLRLNALSRSLFGTLNFPRLFQLQKVCTKILPNKFTRGQMNSHINTCYTLESMEKDPQLLERVIS